MIKSNRGSGNLILPFLTILFLLATLMTQAQSFVLNGSIAGQSSGMLKLSYTDPDGKMVQDSTAIKNGQFQFRGNTTEPRMAYLSGAVKSIADDDPNATSLFLDAAPMTIRLKSNDFKNAVITGSKTEDEYEALEKAERSINNTKECKALTKAYERVSKAYRQAVKAKKDEARIDTLNYRVTALNDQFDSYAAQITQMDLAFFAAHPQSYVTAFQLRFHVHELSVDSLQLFYDGLGRTVRQSLSGKYIAKEIAHLRAGTPGSLAGDFAATELNGGSFTLSALKGKYVLLDFWASWCVPCRISNPHIKALYNRYKDRGFDVVAVSDDYDSAAWRKAVAKDSTGIWHNVLRGADLAKVLKNEENDKDISEKFGVQMLPTDILIDPNGRIIGRYDKGTDEETEVMDAKIATVMAQPFILTGTITGQDTGTLTLYYAGVVDSTPIRNGQFEFRGKITDPGYAYLSNVVDEGNTADGRNSTVLFLEPAKMNVSVKVDEFNNAVVTGSKTQDEYAALQKSKAAIYKEMAPILVAANTTHAQLDAYNARLAQKDYTFFAAHPKSYVTAYFLGIHVHELGLDSSQLFYNRLGSAIQLSSSGKEIAREIALIRMGSPGSPAMDFTSKELDGDSLTLSALKGKYVLIDFWASWCGPCRKSMPHMKELYSLYKDKGLVVIGVSDDDGDSTAWKKAIAKDGTGIWRNVLRGLDWEKIRKNEKNDKDISNKFGVLSLPTRILIDPNGMIIGRYDKGTDEEEQAMDKKIAEAFNY